MPFDPALSVPGSSLSSWTGLFSPTNPNLTTWYHPATGTMVDYNSLTNTFANVAPGTPRRAEIQAAFGSQISAANAAHAAGSTPVTPTSSASSSGSGATPTSTGSATTPSGSGGGTSFCYPEALRTTKQDRIKFDRYKVGTASIGGSGGLGSLKSKGTTGDSLGTVFLAIPNQITDSNTVDWAGSTIDPIRLQLANRSIEAMRNPTNDVSSMLKQLTGGVFKDIKQGMANSQNRRNLQVYLAQEAVQAQGLLSRLQGEVANPNLELLFNGPQLRPFTFSFRMTPRQASEAAQIKKIIRFFKEGMAIQSKAGDVFLKSPNVFKIQFMNGESTRHKSLPLIKTCALIACDIDYTPDGSYMTVDDPTNKYPMSCYQMTLRFSEIEPIYGDDYKQSGVEADEIGY